MRYDANIASSGTISAISGTYDQSLTVSGIPVQLEAFEVPDPLNITELVAVTGTFTGGLTVGTGSTVIDNGSITTASGTFTGDVSLADLEATFVGSTNMHADTLLTVGIAATHGSAGITSVFEDTEHTSTSTSFADVNCETVALENGVDYLVMYCANHGDSTGTGRSEMQLLHGGTVIALTRSDNNNTISSSTTHNRGNRCQGVYTVTGNGTNTLKFQLRNSANTDMVAAGAMGIIAMPTTNFTENTNYFQETQNGDACVACNVSSTFTDILESTFNITEPGDYIYIGSAECNDDRGNSALESVHFLIDAAVSSPVWLQRGRSVALGFDGFIHMQQINLSSGNHTFTSQLKLQSGSYADGRRGRNILIKKDLFDQFVETNDTTGDGGTASNTYADYSGLDTTYTPNQTEDLVVIAFTNVQSDSLTQLGGVRLRDDSAGINYREDTGHNFTDVTVPSDHFPLFFFHHVKNAPGLSPIDYKVQFRNTANSPTALVHVGKDASRSGGQSNGGSSLFVWSTTLSSLPDLPVTQSVITDDLIIANQIQAESSLTVSGQPVATGTSGGDFELPDPLNITELVAVTGTFSSSLTISGVPVSTGTGVGSHSALSELDYASAAHTGFASEAELISVSGSLQGQIASNIGETQHRSAFVTSTSGISIGDNIGISLPWDITNLDVGGWIDPSDDTAFIVPAGVSNVRMWGQIRYSPNATGQRRLLIRKNNESTSTDPLEGTVVFIIQAPSPDGGTYMLASTATLPAVEGDTFRLIARHSAGTTLTVDASVTTFFIEEVKDIITSNDAITAASGTFTDSLTVSGIAVHTSDGLNATRTFYTAPTSGASPTVLNTVVVEGGIIRTWDQV